MSRETGTLSTAAVLWVPAEAVGVYRDVVASLNEAGRVHAEHFAATGKWPPFDRQVLARVTCIQTERWRAMLGRADDEAVARLGLMDVYFDAAAARWDELGLTSRRRNVVIPPKAWMDSMAGSAWGSIWHLYIGGQAGWPHTRLVLFWRALAEVLQDKPGVAVDAGNGEESVANRVRQIVFWPRLAPLDDAGGTAEALLSAAAWLESANEDAVLDYSVTVALRELHESQAQHSDLYAAVVRAGLGDIARRLSHDELRDALELMTDRERSWFVSLRQLDVHGALIVALKRIRRRRRIH